jgi:hypothetical protein
MRGHFRIPELSENKKLRAYIIGLSLGDGNLSNPNGRAVRLRITCDKRYTKLLRHIIESLRTLFPQNRVGTVRKRGCVDVSVYSNQLTTLLGWRWDRGPKDKQNVRVPPWIKRNAGFSKECLRGLLQTDGSLYNDRGYSMVNFVNTGASLTSDVFSMMKGLGYAPHIQKSQQVNGKMRRTVRLSRDVPQFVKDIDFWKK